MKFKNTENLLHYLNTISDIYINSFSARIEFRRQSYRRQILKSKHDLRTKRI